MIESLITGLVLAAVSGVTFIAYKHPNGYARMYFSLNMATLSMAFGLCVFNGLNVFGSASVINHLVSKMPDLPLSSLTVEASKLHYSLKFIACTVFVAAIILGYFALLKYLPQVLGLNGKGDAGQPSSNETKKGNES